MSKGPNLALFNHIRENGIDAETRDNQYAIIAPIPHFRYTSMGPDTVVGERDMGDTTFDVNGKIFAWFDKWLKGDDAAFDPETPHICYYTMGDNEWQSSDQWPLKKRLMFK